MDRKCLECGKTLHGRSDKKFCDDYCRNNYYNKANREFNAYIRRVNYILKRNRKILKQLNPTGKAKVGKTELITRGFNFKYFTNVYTTKKGHTYYFCYDQGYIPIHNNFYTLVEKQDYVD